MNKEQRILRVLSIDGGGMRGVYSSTYLDILAKQIAARRKIAAVDWGKAFHLIVGTSTGGIIACALAAGIPLDKVTNLYEQYGKRIFPRKMPSTIKGIIFDLFSRSKNLSKGNNSLCAALENSFGDLTMRDVYYKRGIALSIPAVEMSHHRSWVFKTPHLNGHRDDNFRLVDVCLATSAAPLYRSMAKVKNPDIENSHYIFIDGGLWANNPIMVGLIDALQMTKPGDRIEIFSLGTCSPPGGDIFGDKELHRGLVGWKFGAEVANIAITAQQYAYDKMAELIAHNIERDCRILRFPHDIPSKKVLPYLDLDETSKIAMQALKQQAQADVSLTLSEYDKGEGARAELLYSLFQTIPPKEK